MGRVLTFADPEVIRLAREHFIPVTADDWYQRRRRDDEGEFFRKVADQGPRKGEGGSTRQGIYVFTTGGKLLAYRNHHDPAVMRGVISKALADFKKLPESERKPGAIQVGNPSKVDPTYTRQPPKNGLVVTVFTRILDRNDQGEYCVGQCSFKGGDMAARDHLWLTEEEWKSLLPTQPAGKEKNGARYPLPERLVQRIVRFHLVDNTRGEPPLWTRQQVRMAQINLIDEGDGKDKRTLRLEGQALLATHPDPQKADRGFDVRLFGYITFQPSRKAIDSFDVVAVGEHWGEGPYTRRARPGRQPLGIAFQLSRGDSAADRVPPQAARMLQSYLYPEKN